MYLCYVDESGTPEPGNTSHYVLSGVSIPIECWKSCDCKIEKIKTRYQLTNQELHVAWLLRSYPEQNKIPNFEKLNYLQRKQQITAYRTSELLRLQRTNNPKLYHQTKKNFRKTKDYVHLTKVERKKLMLEVATEVSKWGFVRLFSECIDKIHFSALRPTASIETQAFEQVVTRFEIYIETTNKGLKNKKFGMLIHDNNETVAKKHTLLMKHFHRDGTLWTKVRNIIETPLFVSSELTSMVQIADLCSYSLRRYLENNESELFDLIFKRADRRGDATALTVVGVRHFTKTPCACKICSSHNRK